MEGYLVLGSMAAVFFLVIVIYFVLAWQGRRW